MIKQGPAYFSSDNSKIPTSSSKEAKSYQPSKGASEIEGFP